MIEFEYVAMSHRMREEVWIQRFLNKLFLKQAIKKMKMLRDNKTNHTLTRDLENQNRTKHINMIYYHIQGLVEDRELRIEWISSASMLADGLAKVLSISAFKKYWEEWSLIEAWEEGKLKVKVTWKGK